MLFVPKIGDEKGRLIILKVFFFLQIVAQLGLYFTRSLKFAYAMMIILGMTHSAKNIVSLNHIMEMIPQQADKKPLEILGQGLVPIKLMINENCVNFFLFTEAGFIIIIAATYQFLDNSWWLI